MRAPRAVTKLPKAGNPLIDEDNWDTFHRIVKVIEEMESDPQMLNAAHQKHMGRKRKLNEMQTSILSEKRFVKVTTLKALFENEIGWTMTVLKTRCSVTSTVGMTLEKDGDALVTMDTLETQFVGPPSG